MEYPNLEKLLNQYGTEIKKRYGTNVSKTTIKDEREKLFESVDFDIDFDGIYYSVSLFLNKYWYYVEYGRKSGKRPPVAEIERWIKIKPIVREKRNGKLPTEKSLAYIIARSIGKKGTKPQMTLTKTNDALYTEMKDSIKEAFIADVNEDINRLLNNIW